MRVLRLLMPSLLAVPVLLLLASCGPTPTPPPSPPAADGPVRLAVLVYFDQLRGDYLQRWDGLFGDEGFHRLEREGAWFQNCHYPYADTVTAAGHASVAAGCDPAKHGVIANEWYDPAAAAEVYCVGSDRYPRVPPLPPASTKDGKKKARGVSPERLLTPTLADALKDATGGRGKVVALAGKDRSAVLPGGRRPDACYWFDTDTGTFATSTWYRDQLHPWVAEFNADRPADRWFGRAWERLRPDLDYTAHSGPDDVNGEGKGSKQGKMFPHPTDGGLASPGKDYYGAVYDSPFGNELLLELVERALDAEQLGRGAAPDLLCVSFSSNDVVGHTWGPDSQEVLDVTLRTDEVVRQLLADLDAKVGKGRYVLALTSDHGVCPLPEVAQAQGKEAGRVPSDLLTAKAEAFLDGKFGANEGKAHWVEAAAFPWAYLNRRVLAQRGLAEADVAEALAGWLTQQPGVQAAYTRARLAAVGDDDPVGQAVRRSFQPDRAGDMMVVLKPYYVSWQSLTGTTHGTPHLYDTHVPLLVYGPGVRAGVRQDRVTPGAVAAILAHGLGIAPPAGAEYPVPDGLFEEK